MLASGSYFGTVVQGGYLVSMQLRTGNQGAIHWRKGAVAADNLPFFADGWMDGWMRTVKSLPYSVPVEWCVCHVSECEPVTLITAFCSEEWTVKVGPLFVCNWGEPQMPGIASILILMFE